MTTAAIAPPAVTRRRFTVAEYYRLGEVGILRPDERVELIDGAVLAMPPIGAPHASRVTRINQLFGRFFRERAILSIQNPVRLGQHSEPVPDAALLLPRPDFYEGVHPGPSDVLLVVEVSDSTLLYDRRVKGPLYAAAGIVEYWLVNLPEQVIEVYRQPSPAGYRQLAAAKRGESIAPLAFPDQPVAVNDILGPITPQGE